MLLSDFKRLIIRPSFVNLSLFLILLYLAISFNSSIDFLCSFSAWFTSFSEIFGILATFPSPIFDNFSPLRLLSYLLRVFIKSIYTSVFCNKIIFFSGEFNHFMLWQDKTNKKKLWGNFFYTCEESFFYGCQKIFL